MINPKALFIGPYSENQLEFRRYVEFILNDIIQWRRNYHPSNERLILPDEKIKESWVNTSYKIDRELDKLLGELKQSIPFHNPRFIGHMHSDLVIPSLLGYLAGQLYNQNNVVGESSPVTTWKEVEYIKYLCEMFSFPLHEYAMENDLFSHKNKLRSTGHLTSGGTVANIEAVWTARNVKYYPVSLKLFVDKFKNHSKYIPLIDLISTIEINNTSINKLKYNEVISLPIESSLSLSDKFKISFNEFIDKKDNSFINQLKYDLERCSVRVMGVHGIHNEVEEKISYPKLVVPQSRHYSWEKAMDLIGLGSSNIEYVGVDDNFRIDAQKFDIVCRSTSNILMAVAVMGTTEEGVVDPIGNIVEIKQDFEKNRKGIWLHIDAAYGGFYTSLFNDVSEDHKTMNYSILSEKLAAFRDNISTNKTKINTYDRFMSWIDESIANDFKSTSKADSITIDPHKMGYIPYSAGAILYRDNRVKSFIEKKAPYLASGDSDFSDPSKIYLGGSTLEGSRSGAAALACYLSSRIITNDINGYGRIAYETFVTASYFLEIMQEKNNLENNQALSIKTYPIYDVLTNIICFAVGVKGVALSASDLNKLNNRLYEEMSAEKNKSMTDYKFIVSKTSLNYCKDKTDHDYSRQINTFLKKFDINLLSNESEDFDLTLLRSTFMNPMLNDDQRENLFLDFFEYVEDCVHKILPEILFESLIESENDKRYKVLWIENQVKIKELKKAIIKGGKNIKLDISKFVDIGFVTNLEELQETGSSISEYDVFIVDMNLSDSLHREWASGINTLIEINKVTNEKALFLIYSQFLNENFTIQDFGVNKSKLYHSQILKSFLKHHLALEEDNFIPKSLKISTEKNVDGLIEMRDLDEIIIKLSKIIFNNMKNRKVYA